MIIYFEDFHLEQKSHVVFNQNSMFVKKIYTLVHQRRNEEESKPLKIKERLWV